jgi:hypothetical protein
MLVMLRSGWCQGDYLTDFTTAPKEIRAVTGPDGPAVLDLDDDQPEDDEIVHIYRLVGPDHFCGEGWCRSGFAYDPVRGGEEETFRRARAILGYDGDGVYDGKPPGGAR